VEEEVVDDTLAVAFRVEAFQGEAYLASYPAASLLAEACLA
jgi:hypothetical protein